MLTGEVHSLLRAQNVAFKSGDSAAYKLARKICLSKKAVCTKLSSYFANNRDSQQLGQGFKTITDYKPPLLEVCHNDSSLSDDLNDVYACFEANNHSSTDAFILTQ